jgi:small GTP-binding protein
MKTQWSFKVIVGGDGGVGKTAFIERFCTGKFIEDHKITIGAQFTTKIVELENDNVTLQIWDFAGEERFRFILDAYCRGASGALLCYDLTDSNTFINLKKWIEIVHSGCTTKIPILVIGTKYDLPNHEVNANEVESFCKENDLTLHTFCSSKTGENVNDIFSALAKWIIHYALK